MANVPRIGVLAAAVLLAAAAARADDDLYQIKLHRPEKVGQKFAINTTVDESSAIKVVVDGKDFKNESHDAEYTLEATLTVTDVDAQGRETGFHLQIKKLEAAEEHAVASPLVEPNSEIDVVYKNGKPQFSLKLGGLSDAATRALATIFEPPHSDNTDDQMFGTPDKKRPGDTWSVNPKAIAVDAAALSLSPDKIDGDVTLVGKVDLAGTPALELHTNVEVSEMTIKDLGPSKEGKIGIKIESEIPVDVNDPSSQVKMNMKTHGVFTPEKDGKTGNVTLDTEVTRLETRMLQK